MAIVNRFQPVFEQLRALLQPFAPELMLKINTDDNYYLAAPHSPRWRAEVMFAAVQIKKNYVSFYLMPVYMYPELLDNMSSRLKKRMHGKSCFNFTKVESDLLAELTELTTRSFTRFRVENLP
jgi:hypothetical protein